VKHFLRTFKEEREREICNWFNGVCDSHSKLIENAKINPQYQNLEKKFGFSARRVIEPRHWLLFFSFFFSFYLFIYLFLVIVITLVVWVIVR
jgi:hypothetical protein